LCCITQPQQQSPPQLGQAQAQAPLVHEFLSLKRVLREGHGWKDMFGYVLERLEELAADSYLSAYDWERGGALHDRNVSVELPTDADLLMHVFLWRCDSLSEHRLHEADQPFVKQNFLMVRGSGWPFMHGVPPHASSRRAFLACAHAPRPSQMTEGEEGRSVRGRNMIVRHAASPPHFSVVEGGTAFRIPPGKQNCFHAIVVFLYEARRFRWLPITNEGYRRLLHSVFGSATHPVELEVSNPRTPT
jgi:hypothetical protein